MAVICVIYQVVVLCAYVVVSGVSVVVLSFPKLITWTTAVNFRAPQWVRNSFILTCLSPVIMKSNKKLKQEIQHCRNS
jgi:hypothetical protein